MIKFKKLRLMKKPTGDSDCPTPVKRAKRIYYEIEKQMAVAVGDDDDEGEEHELAGSYSVDLIVNSDRHIGSWEESREG